MQLLITRGKQTDGFTIVELLIVIVVIGILSTMSLVTYSAFQAKARDSARQSDVAEITKALELYYTDYGKYPNGTGSTVINSSWSTTSDASWQNFLAALQPYIGNKVLADPVSTPGAAVLSGVGFNYAYFSNSVAGVTYCGATQNQMYLLVYKLEASSQINTLTGNCTVTPVGPYGGASASNYRVSKS